MSGYLTGIHHITAMCGEPRRNVEFYTEALGQRLVKKTVNFDDPGTYHLYYGDGRGTPGSILTFFPWPDARPGKRGIGETAAFAYAAPARAQDFWETRLADYGARQAEPETRFGEKVLSFQDPDGVWFELVLTDDLAADNPTTDTSRAVTEHRPTQQDDVPETEAADGHADSSEIGQNQRLGAFRSATLWVEHAQPTVDFLQNVFAWDVSDVENGRARLVVPSGAAAQAIDVVAVPSAGRGDLGPGSIHHIAFRVADAEEQQAWRQRVLLAGIPATNVRDRQYFQSVYFREPGGVLFEIATDIPGFTVDEEESRLGEGLMLPPWLESRRVEIAAGLPRLDNV